MHSTSFWLRHFKANAGQHRINWDLPPAITRDETRAILLSMQAWQLGETSDGQNLAAATVSYARKINDPLLVETIGVFIKEEQKHGENLGRYLDAIGQPRLKVNWGDTLFRKVRHFNTSMEIWTLAALTVESIAQVYYQALKDATGCPLLKAICTDILIDEAYHITFQTERMASMYDQHNRYGKRWRRWFYGLFFYSTAVLVWLAHRSVLVAGGNSFALYRRKIPLKYAKTIKRAVVLPPFYFA